MTLVKVVWDDAGSFVPDDEDGNVWHTKEKTIEAFGQANFTQASVGFVVFETDDDMIIAQSIDEQKGMEVTFANPLRIPKAMILSVTEVT